MQDLEDPRFSLFATSPSAVDPAALLGVREGFGGGADRIGAPMEQHIGAPSLGTWEKGKGKGGRPCNHERPQGGRESAGGESEVYWCGGRGL